MVLAGCAATSSGHSGGDLATPAKRDIAMQLVSSAENSTLDWRSQYGYLEDIGDERGYTGGLIGFTSGTADMLQLVEDYTRAEPANPLAAFLPALRAVNGSASHEGLGAPFEQAWAAAARDPAFRHAQDAMLDSMYFDPAVSRAKKDGLGALGQFIYYDAIVMHGPGSDGSSFGGIRSAAMAKAKTPTQGGDETRYLNAFLDVRVKVMREEAAHDDVSRVSTEQRIFVREGNLDLHTPLRWKVYGDPYRIG
jgi:chitosanase